MLRMLHCQRATGAQAIASPRVSKLRLGNPLPASSAPSAVKQNFATRDSLARARQPRANPRLRTRQFVFFENTRLLLLIVLSGCLVAALGTNRAAAAETAIVCDAAASSVQKLAARELRRYVYVCTGEKLPIIAELRAAKDVLLIDIDAQLDKEQYRLKTTIEDRGDHKRKILRISGGSDVAVLYGVYHFAERLGVRFYLHGDVVPDAQTRFAVPEIDETHKPLFDRRGIQPFHDFPEGPDWWNVDAYKAILAQLPKLRMNFLGLHCYPEGGVGPEPLVWIGQPSDFDAKGDVQFSYPARHFTTANPTGAWGYQPQKTFDYHYGAAALFPSDDYGDAYMQGMNPWPEQSAEQSNELFDRMGTFLNDVFTFARGLGVKTCVGTETPLTIPTRVKERLKAQGKDPSDPKVVQEVYEGMFRRIMATHPLDYYWFWTPEGWTWRGAKQEQVDATLADFRAALAAHQRTAAPFTLATCGWVLGPPQDRALFDNILPKNMPLSCINREVGHAPVEPGFANVTGRPKWAIPWLEDDPAMIIPQLWAGRMRRDAADALKYGCTGLLGIHWRTQILGPNVSALAQAAWDQQGWNPAFESLDDKQTGAESAEPKTEGPLGGRYARFVGVDFADTDEDTLYQTVRFNLGGYHLELPNGTYRVTLKFCEPHYTSTHRRAFGVSLQGTKVVDTLDVFRRVGRNKALDLSFDNIPVTDGWLRVDFDYQTEYPCIAGIVVAGEKTTRKINCGGPAWHDYVADWPASDKVGSPRGLPVDDFYRDWAAAQFGDEVAQPVAEIFTAIDGQLPRPSTWVKGPGGIKPDERSWNGVEREYAFVDRLEQIRPRVRGAGNLERFDYWLDQFRYLRAVGRVNCIWSQSNAAIVRAKAAKTPDARKAIAQADALPLRIELVEAVTEVHRHLLNATYTPGGLGNVTNWQQHILPTLLDAPGQELSALLDGPLPAEAMPSNEYPGRPRLFVPVVRNVITAGETLTLEVVILGATPTDAALYWRRLGPGQLEKVPLRHVARGVYRVAFPAGATGNDLEYYVAVKTASGDTLKFPATADRKNQTVVVIDK